MISKNVNEAFVWVWLPGQVDPVVAGKVSFQSDQYVFVYGQSYRNNSAAISLSPFELPLQEGVFEPQGMNNMHSCIRDALPDAWGRRLIDYQYPSLNPNEIDYGLLSGSDRIGALDFQLSSTGYVPRGGQDIGLDSVGELIKFIESDKEVPKKLEPILLHGTSVGGARPKCLVRVNGVEYVAKFSLSVDHYPILRAEYLAMSFAKLIGLNVAEVTLDEALGRDVLLVRRFDRASSGARKLMLSGLSLLGLNEMEARYASYLDLADVIRAQFVDPKESLKELYRRLVLNVLVGNTDDHARNHSAFWDGETLRLAPAYDVCPQMRAGHEASQAMMVEGDQGQLSTLKNCLSVCGRFLVKPDDARALIQYQLDMLRKHWAELCEQAKLNKREQARLWGSVICSEFALTAWV